LYQQPAKACLVMLIVAFRNDAWLRFRCRRLCGKTMLEEQ